MAKFYAYAYAGSGLAHQRPLPAEKILKILNSPPSDPEKFEIFELVPVKPVTKTVTVLEKM